MAAHQYNFTVRQLRDIMEYRGTESIEYIRKNYSSVDNICTLLNTSINEGLHDPNDIIARRKYFGANIHLSQDSNKTGNTTVVIRAGHQVMIPVQDLVVGDVCPLSANQWVPADGLLIEGSDSDDLTVDESMLTGEKDLIKKSQNADPIFLSGTKIVTGWAKILIIAVGTNSQIEITF